MFYRVCGRACMTRSLGQACWRARSPQQRSWHAAAAQRLCAPTGATGTWRCHFARHGAEEAASASTFRLQGHVVGLACGNVSTDIEGPGTAEHVGGDEGEQAGGTQSWWGCGQRATCQGCGSGGGSGCWHSQQVPPRQRPGTSLVQDCPHLCMSTPASVCDQVIINARAG